jgi:hypothetical protein
VKQDRFLIYILAAIILLTGLAIILFFVRQGSQRYAAEDTPEGVLHNYVLALQWDDYMRAYGYLKESENKPGFSDFHQALLTQSYSLKETAVKIGEVGEFDEQVFITLTLLHNNSDPFNSGWREQSSAILIQQDGVWKISNMPYPYWDWSWYTDENPKPVEARP